MNEQHAADDYRVYILRCADDTLYTGIARDVAARLKAHESGSRGAKYLRGRGPLELLFDASAGTRSDAQRLEYSIKRLKRDDKLKLAAGDKSLLKSLRIVA